MATFFQSCASVLVVEGLPVIRVQTQSNYQLLCEAEFAEVKDHRTQLHKQAFWMSEFLRFMRKGFIWFLCSIILGTQAIHNIYVS